MASSRLILTCLVAWFADAVPSFDINLDEAPEMRWVSVASYYKTELTDMLQKLVPIVHEKYPESQQDAWINDVPFDPEYAAELQGMVTAIDHPEVNVGRLKWLNMLYEMDSPYTQLGCTGVLWAMPNGTVVQGRNMDDFSDDKRIIDWPAITFDANVHRGGVLLFTMTNWPGSVGVHTGMRVSHGPATGWAIAQNTRRPNLWQDNLAAASNGGQVFGLAVRRVMESTPDFKSALNQIYGASFMAPQYFIMSGASPLEGAVLTMDRLGQHAASTPPIQYVGNTTDDWHIVQTNDDITGYPADARRPLANYLLSSTSRSITENDQSMLEFMHTTHVFNSGTLFTTVMVPMNNFYMTILPDEPPQVMDGDSASQSMAASGAAMMWTAPMALPQFEASPTKRLPSAADRQWIGDTAKPKPRGFLAAQRKEYTEPPLEMEDLILPEDETSMIQQSIKLEA